MAIFMLSLLVFPGFGGAGCFAKWYVIKAALQSPSPQTKLAVVLVLTSVVSAGYYLYVVMVMFMRARTSTLAIPARAGGLTRFVVAAAAILLIGIGFFPEQLVRVTRGSAPLTAVRVTPPGSNEPLPASTIPLPPSARR